MKHTILYLTFFLLGNIALAQKPGSNDSIQNNNLQQPSQYTDSIANVKKLAEQGDAAAQTILGFWYYNGFETISQDYKQAVSWWEKAAKQNNPDAIANLGYCFLWGQGVEPDSIKASNLFENAAKGGSKNVIPMHDQLAREQKSIFSALLLEDIYKKGIGTKTDLKKAGEYLELAAEYGHEPSMLNYAMSLYNSGRFDQAAPWLKKLSDQGNTEASLAYGLLLFDGKGVTQDKKTGVDCLTKAAEKGNNSAAVNLGRIYLEGDGVEMDSLKAFEYLKKSAPYDRTRRAAWMLAKCYKDGIGTQKDYFLATQWMAESIDDSRGSSQRLEKLFEDDNNGAFTNYLRGLYKYVVDENFEEAQKYFNIVEKNKIAEGTTMIARCLANAKNPKRNVNKAVRLFTKVLPHSPAANYHLSQIYANGDGVQKDTSKAISLLKSAADAGIPDALCVLADRCMTGDGVSKDITKAANLYLQAEAQRHLSPESAKNLAKCYELRVAALPDLNKADARIKALNNMKPNNKLNELLAKVPFK